MYTDTELPIPPEVLNSPDAPAQLPQDVPTATALKLWIVLARANAAVEAHARADIDRHGLTPAEFGVLEALYHKGPLLLGDVQRRTLISSGGTTFLIDRLEKKGLVERRLCDSDRRARYAALTAKGRELIAEIFPQHAESIRRAMAGLGLADQRAMTDLLRVLGQEAASLSLPGARPPR
jgi:MarR family transcriptional regulator, 2-MHQ and catechol-resistance regulon repressor